MDTDVEYYSESLESFAVLIILLSMILPIFFEQILKIFHRKTFSCRSCSVLCANPHIISKPSATFKIASAKLSANPSSHPTINSIFFSLFKKRRPSRCYHWHNADYRISLGPFWGKFKNFLVSLLDSLQKLARG